jgi:hypothetical protein
MKNSTSPLPLPPPQKKATSGKIETLLHPMGILIYCYKDRMMAVNTAAEPQHKPVYA